MLFDMDENGFTYVSVQHAEQIRAPGHAKSLRDGALRASGRPFSADRNGV